jgi:hypothetical protein
MYGGMLDGTRLHAKKWEFALEDGSHTVEVYYSLFSSREVLKVDGVAVSDENRRVLRSEYQFEVGGHACRAIIQITPLGAIACDLKVGGRKVELLPSRTLLRPAHAEGALLLKPSSPADAIPDEQLVRPAPITNPEE